MALMCKQLYPENVLSSAMNRICRIAFECGKHCDPDNLNESFLPVGGDQFQPVYKNNKHVGYQFGIETPSKKYHIDIICSESGDFFLFSGKSPDVKKVHIAPHNDLFSLIKRCVRNDG